MKILIKITLILVILLISYGYYTKNTDPAKGNAFIGIGILMMVFVLMPLFLIHRYRNKKLTSFVYKHQKDSQD